METEADIFVPTEQHKKAAELIEKLKNEIEGKFNDICLCKKLLNEIKVYLTLFPSCSPNPERIFKEELLLGRECMEYGVLLSVKNRDTNLFERHIALLRPYYFDYQHLLGPSEREFMIKGMYLLNLLASNRLGEFHIYLQQIPLQDRSNEFIMEAIELEENLMDGNYTKVFDLKKHKNEKNKNKIYMYDDFFIENLLKTVRQKIAFSLEHSCKHINVNLAIQKLFLNSIEELKALADSENERKLLEEKEMLSSASSSYSLTSNAACSSFSQAPVIASSLNFLPSSSSNLKMWILKGDNLCFVQTNEEKKEIPALQIIHQLIGYATELERIV